MESAGTLKMFNTWQLSNQLLRRDEIWFTEKSNEGISTLYSLADFVDEDGTRIRKDENYEKNYLIGKYGAIPSLKSIDIFKEG
jgi:AAA15 family ATPase/GTPase